MALALAFLTAVAFPTAAIPDLKPLVPITAVIVVIMLVLVRMFATSISDARLEAWVKLEIVELIAGVIIIAIILAYFVGSNGVTVLLTGQTDYIQVSQGILDKWINTYDAAFRLVIQSATRLRAAATYSPYTAIPIWFFSINYASSPLSGVAVMLVSLNMAAQALTNAVFLAEGMRILVAFFDVVMPSVLLPLSCVIRLIPYTRKLGNSLIAVCIGAMVFFPLSIILADMLNAKAGGLQITTPDLNALDANPWAMVAFEPLCESEAIRLILSLNDVGFAIVTCLPCLLIPFAGPACFATCFNLVRNVIYPIIMMVFQIASTALIAAWEGAYSGNGGAFADAVFDALRPFLASVNGMVLLSYFDFIFILLITITGARSVAAALGGEMYLAGIQRFI